MVFLNKFIFLHFLYYVNLFFNVNLFVLNKHWIHAIKIFLFIKFIAYDHSTITKESLLNALKFFYFLASFPRSFENIFIRRHLISLFFSL
jgi:hypothetical protein